MRYKTSVAAAGLMLAVLVCMGCSPGGLKRAAVSGKVLVDQMPLKEGAISFFPVEGAPGPSVGAVIQDGRYRVPRDKGVMVGKNRIEIRAFRKTGRKIPDPTEPTRIIDEIIPAIPPEYNSKSTLIREIKEGSNSLDFDLPGSR